VAQRLSRLRLAMETVGSDPGCKTELKSII
jgi:hypothetical protein